MKYVCIIIGGGIGAVLRYISTQIIQTICTVSFPVGTFFVNSLGALLIGFLFNTFEQITAPAGLRLFVITGFLGGYTTFSTYSLETVRYCMHGNLKQAFMNIALNNIVCMLCVWLGIRISNLVIGD
ncbi:MAG: fluoride efflux transporter CrcB [Treponema sp.]|jgi:CrcB protein|nr:fluoride efflux transporter CrcB [Treponema sp.]